MSDTAGIIIKKAGPEDLGLLMDTRMEVLRDVFRLTPDQDTDELEKNSRDYYRNTLKNREHTAVLAFLRGRFAGCGGICYYREMPTPDNTNGLCGFLMNVYTRPECRRMGIGRRIVEYLADEARRRGVTKIYLEASKEGIPLYRACGFVPMEDYYKLPS